VVRSGICRLATVVEVDPQPFAKPHPEGTSLVVWVVAGARSTGIVGAHGDALKIRVEAAAEKGRANRAAARVLEEATGARARLLRGTTSRRKTFLLAGVTPDAVVESLGHGAHRTDSK